MSQPPSHPPLAPGVPFGTPPPRPPKYRPSAGWLVLGCGLILTAIVVAVGMSIWLFVGLFDFDAAIDSDGQPHVVDVGTDRDRMLWMDSTTQSCQVIDLQNGRPIALRQVTGEYTRSDSQGDFEGLLRFAPGSGHLQITCVQTDGGPSGTVIVSALPRLGSSVAAIIVTVAVPSVLGLVGFVVLMWTGVLWSLRQPRPRQPY